MVVSVDWRNSSVQNDLDSLWKECSSIKLCLQYLTVIPLQKAVLQFLKAKELRDHQNFNLLSSPRNVVETNAKIEAIFQKNQTGCLHWQWHNAQFHIEKRRKTCDLCCLQDTTNLKKLTGGRQWSLVHMRPADRVSQTCSLERWNTLNSSTLCQWVKLYFKL